MKTCKNRLLLNLSITATMALGFNCASYGALLSGNYTGTAPAGDYPGPSTTAIATGATYTWQNLATGNGPGNTDPGTLAGDGSFTKMQDGFSAASGGTYSTFSTYDTAVGQTSIFDLQTTYQIDFVTLSANVNSVGNASGIGYFTAYTSSDGTNFTLFGRWDDAAPANSQNAILTIDPGSSVNARYVMFYTNRFAGNVGESALPGQTFYHQVILGEQAIWGVAVPEPTSLSLLALGGIALCARRKRRQTGSL